MNTFEKSTELAGRFLLVAIFLISGLGKIGDYAGTQAYMTSAGVPGAVLPLVILVEAAGAVAIIVGWWTRLAALVLAGFSLLAAVLFHADFAQQIAAIMFLKNIAIAGGLLVLAVHGPGPWSLDARRSAAGRSA